MLKLPVSLESELDKEFQFTRKLYNEAALLHTWNEGRLLIAPLPPYRQGSVELYLNKALKSTAETVVLLLPCDVSTDWFNRIWQLARTNPDKVQMRFFNGRIKYEGEGQLQYRISSCLVVVRPVEYFNSSSAHERTA